jgi:hypothetical protein
MSDASDRNTPAQAIPLAVQVAMYQRRFEAAPDSLGTGVTTAGEPVGLLLALTKAN